MSDTWIEAINQEAPLVDPQDLQKWILKNDETTLVLNKPGWLVCHPSKAGPWSSLVGACREHFGLNKIHLVARLDRETSGLVILAKTPARSRRLQMAIERRQVDKIYLAILEGKWGERPSPLSVDVPIGRDKDSPVFVKQRAIQTGGGQSAKSQFFVIHEDSDFTVALVRLITGRKHQIRVHAGHLGNPLVGDKIYGPDSRLFLHFIDHGWDSYLAEHLRHPRQALHAMKMHFRYGEGDEVFFAPLPEDMASWLKKNQSKGAPEDWNVYIHEKLQGLSDEES